MNGSIDYPDAEVLHQGLLPKRFEAIAGNLAGLYPQCGELIVDRLVATLSRYSPATRRGEADDASLWDEGDVLLIAYGDSVRGEGGRPLRDLKAFCDAHLRGLVSSVHVLPFSPWSSDDGFSVIDYRAVDEALGDWADIEALGGHFRLMFDLVLNHCSTRSGWFRDFAKGILPYSGYFMTADPEADLSAVVRPRSTPLLTPFETRLGRRHVWTTFSADQVDLDWRNPDVFFEFLDILLDYALRGGRFIRLDAVAFLWKEPGTPCIHLPQTHLIVRILRQVLDLVVPGTVLLTETNVPHDENVSYFGDGDEARMVYNFALPPLLLHAFLRGDARWLTRWARDLGRPPRGCAFLNFSASHDGIGLRPAHGILPDGEVTAMVDAVRLRGGRVSMRRLPDGGEAPYELNTTWFSALLPPGRDPDAIDRQRFLCSQSVVLTLAGMPALYYHSLFGSPNDAEAVGRDGSNRAINRRRLRMREVDEWTRDPGTHQGAVFDGMRRMLAVRATLPAMHPDAFQLVHDLGGALFVVERRSKDGQRILCAHNVTGSAVTLVPSRCGFPSAGLVDRLGGGPLKTDRGALRMPPHGFLWIEARPAA